MAGVRSTVLFFATLCVGASLRGDGGPSASGQGARPVNGARAPSAGPNWIRDFDQGLKKARAEKKDLFLVFTGHGWCGNCDLLDQEVFQKPEFVRATANSFVFVELDYTFGDSPAEKQRERAYRELQKRYLAPGVPQVVLADADGLPYAIVTGYTTGFGVPKSLALIQEARASRVVRDQKFAAAKSATGHERAELLHAGLQAIAGQLGTLEDLGNDPVLTFYPQVVAEINKLEPADSPIRAAYEARQKERDVRLVIDSSIFEKLKAFDRKRDYKGAVAFLNERLKEKMTPEVRWRLLTARHVYLEWDDQYAAALADARELLAAGDRSLEDREWLLDREAFNLINLGRIDEGRSQYEQRIRSAQSPAKKLQLMRTKAEMIRGRPGVTFEEGLKGWREYREACKPGTDGWITATWVMGRMLMLEKRYPEALALQEDFLRVKPNDPGILLDMAECSLAQGNKEAARTRIHEAEAALPAASERQSEIAVLKKDQARIAKLREQLDAPKK
jgi:thioredoxin-related protein